MSNGDGTVTYTCVECGETVTQPVFSMAAMAGLCPMCMEIRHPDAGCIDD